MKDWLEALASLRDGHFAMIAAIIMLYVPFTVALLVLNPTLIVTINPFTYILVGLCLGFITFMPTVFVAIATRYTPEKGDDANGMWGLITLFTTGCIGGVVWTTLSVGYCIIVPDRAILPYVIMMTIVFCFIFPAVVFLGTLQETRKEKSGKIR